MKTAIRLLVLSVTAFTLTVVTAKATHTVYAPNYPTLAQLESGWNAAFVSWLTVEYGGSPVITSTVTYAGQEGQIFVVSSFTNGVVNGSIVGRAFDPHEAIFLGDGTYQYNVQADGAFRCSPIGGCSACKGTEQHHPDGSYERICRCTVGMIGEESPGGCQLIPASNFVGSYAIKPSDYSTLPALN